jgi:hypothetical protein
MKKIGKWEVRTMQNGNWKYTIIPTVELHIFLADDFPIRKYGTEKVRFVCVTFRFLRWGHKIEFRKPIH